MNSDAIILRSTTYSPLTNKGAELTNAEIDQNFINVYKDLKDLNGSAALPAWDSGTAYPASTAFVSYADLVWRSVGGSTGVTPGSDPTKWVQYSPVLLAHVQNTDTKLAEGTANEVTAAALKALVDAGPAVSIYTTDYAFTGNREGDLSGYNLRLINGKEFYFEATNAPTGGSANFERKGYGSSGSNIVDAVSSAFGDIVLIYADGYKEFFGESVFNNKVAFGDAISASAKVKILSLSDTYALDCAAVGVPINAYSTGNHGMTSFAASGSYVGIDASGYYGVRGTARGGSGGYGGGFVENGQAGALYTDGKIRAVNLPTSSAGLSSGEVWNDSGTLKIV